MLQLHELRTMTNKIQTEQKVCDCTQTEEKEAMKELLRTLLRRMYGTWADITVRVETQNDSLQVFTVKN